MRSLFAAAVARAAGAEYTTLDIAVIDVPVLRLDHRIDRWRLHETIERIRPSASARACSSSTPWCACMASTRMPSPTSSPSSPSMRNLQRRFATAVVLVHNARKSGATRPARCFAVRQNCTPGATATCRSWREREPVAPIERSNGATTRNASPQSVRQMIGAWP